MSDGRMHPDDLERLAELVADRLVERFGVQAETKTRGSALVDAAEVARRFRVDRSWVYAHADELGAVRLGNGARPRLRFDFDTVAAALTARQTSEGSLTSESPVVTGVPARRRRRRSGTRPELLPIRGDRA